MTFGPGAVERFRELEQDLHPLALAWLRDGLRSTWAMRGTAFPPSVVVQHQGLEPQAQDSALDVVAGD
jgi:hypothetical protein